jgi:hypothetical protein
MSPELDKQLVEKYPMIFVNRHADMKTTAMCWGFDHNDGWYWIIDNLCSCIQGYIDNNSHLNITQVVATQVKEKYGSLRFYYDGGDEKIDGMVWLAEHQSWNTCENCGSTKNIIHTEGWIQTLCKSCHTPEENKI